jgi:glycosyltransferase involved in cell wall biosynthesis
MKLLFDLSAVQPSQGKFHGGGEYAKAVLYELLKKRSADFDCIYLSNEWIDPEIITLLKRKNIKLIQITKKSDIESILKEKSYKTFYSAMPYDLSDINFGATKFILTIHGIRDLEMPSDKYEYLYTESFVTRLKFIIKRIFSKWYRSFIKRKFHSLLNHENKLVLVPSNHTKFSLLTHFKINPDELHVFYSPLKVSVKPSISEKDKQNQELLTHIKDYILLLGGNRWIKNCYRALLAIDQYFDNSVPVIVVGGTIIQKYFKHKNSFHFLEYVESSTLEHLYENCNFLLYPTLNEGFGYPPLEVMKYGKPVISSAIASITEIYGDSLLYFNPFSLEEIAARIKQIMTDKKTYKKYSSKSRIQFKKISQIQNEMLKELVTKILN